MKGPIGVFDSGVGGLTVVRELVERFPGESVVYFGDTARVPYGIKSKQTIERFAVEDMAFLMRFDPKLVIVACNTASANAMARLEQEFSCPIIDVVRPGASQACSVTGSGKIGLIATEATVRSKAYERAVASVDADVRVFSKACPLFVPMVEEGRTGEDPIVGAAAWEYLSAFDDIGIDTIILGCTHYPAIREAIAGCMPEARLVDSSSAAVRVVAEQYPDIVGNHSTGSGRTGEAVSGSGPSRLFYVSDNPDRFQAIGSRMTGLALENVKLVDLSEIAMGDRELRNAGQEGLR